LVLCQATDSLQVLQNALHFAFSAAFKETVPKAEVLEQPQLY
jgi:hypothetical protein